MDRKGLKTFPKNLAVGVAWAKELRVAVEASRKAHKILTFYFGQNLLVRSKYKAGLVTDADVASEKAICRHIYKHFPDHNILGEESGLITHGSQKVRHSHDGPAQSAPNLWYIDPLDGTTNFVHGIPCFCISIALEVKGQLVVGVVDVPLLKQTFVATHHGGAFLNGRPLKISSRRSVKNSLLATGFHAHRQTDLNLQLKLAKKMIQNSRGIRRLGSAAYDLCLVASGAFDGYWELDLMPWDTAAGTLLVREAGGVVTDYCGKPYYPYSHRSKLGIVAGSPFMHKKIVQECQFDGD